MVDLENSEKFPIRKIKTFNLENSVSDFENFNLYNSKYFRFEKFQKFPV